MKNKSLLLLLATSALLLGACGGNNGDTSTTSSATSSATSQSTETSSQEASSEASQETSSEETSEASAETSSEETSSAEESTEELSSDAESTEETSSGGGEEIIHQDPFVRTIADPSALRNFDERFDEMADDFTGATINGETNGTLNPSTLRVLVDSQDRAEPTTPDASIYKVGTGYYDIDKFDGIGFTIRMVGNKALDLSNLVLGLRGGDGYQVYPINLAEAVDPDGDDLPNLGDEFVDLIVSPQLSIDDANTVYKNLDGTDSELKVLDEILGLHLYALDQECSAVLEIKEVFLVKAGDRTTVDAFNRADVNKADDTCWWRDSTGFIVRKGVTLTKGQTYTAPAPTKAYQNLVLTILGDTTGAAIKIGNGVATWGTLKDNGGQEVSHAVDGAFYSLVINAEQSGLVQLDTGFQVTTDTELTIAQAFYTDLEVPAPVLEYPTFDVNSVFEFDTFNREQSGFNGDYDAAIADPITIAAGLSYQLSYNNGDKVAVNGSALVFDATELGGADYINYKACNDNLVGNYDYMIMALKAEDGATLDNFRFNIGNGVTYINQMYSAEGLKVATLDQADYPYIRDGFTWLVIDLAASGMVRGSEPFIDYYYSGAGKLYVDFVAFANAETEQYEDVLNVEKTYEEGAGYDYAGYLWSPAESVLAKMEIETTGTIDSIRFEGLATEWFHDGHIVDQNGEPISGESGSGTYYINLVASGLKAEGTGQGIHVHGDGGNGAVTVKIYSVDPIPQTKDTLYVEKTYEEGAGYDYAGYLWSPAESRYAKFVAETEGTIDSIRFEGLATEWFHDGHILDQNGEQIPATAGAGTYIIDLVASGLKAEGTGQGIHVHGDGGNGAIAIKVYSVDPIPNYFDIKFVDEHTVMDLSGYNWVGGADNYGADFLVLNLKSEDEGVDLRSLRFTTTDGAEAWVKDGAVIDETGAPIARETAVTSEGITLVIDLAASGLAGPNIHIHMGGFEESAGSVTVSATLQYKTNSTGHILAVVGR